MIAVSAQQLMPYLADAVPGWFQAAIYAPRRTGSEVAYADNFRFHPDPVLHYEIPRDGEYTVEINDSFYRGREDFVYRMALGELPFVTGIFPLGGKPGEQQPLLCGAGTCPADLTEDAVANRLGSIGMRAPLTSPLNRLPSLWTRCRSASSRNRTTRRRMPRR